MLSWKEKVADKLSRLLADSPSSPSPSAADFPIASHESQAVSFSSKEFSTPKKSTFSSYISSLLPTSSGIDADKQNSPACRHNRRTLSSRLLPVQLDCRDDHKTKSESDETVEFLKEKLEHVSGRNINRSNGTEEASTSHDSEEYLSYFLEKSVFISADLFEFLQSSLPNIVKGRQWVLLYSTWKHGISLHTLLRRSIDLPGPCLLIAGDMKGAIFGGLLDSPLKPTAKRKYQGTNQTFVFTTIYGAPRLFRATGSNRYYYLCLNDLLAFGGGENFALRLDEDLLHGTSGPCETFGNLCLAHSAEFELKNVESVYQGPSFSKY
uniref:Oxidation resistance protein 1 isoform X2 n=1 Tax=Elaeis guineensis var. tenera TaxID=51953 RepID=A0A6J0PP81_ELAGV|nr:oxidation resistance protein 1 isoform X2 [Elaeis guineensis]